MSSADPIDQCAAATPEGALLVCYDASEDAKYAIKEAGRLLAARPALVVTVWQPIAALGSFGWSEATTSMVNLVELDRAAAADGGPRGRASRHQSQRSRLEDHHRDRRQP
jgi:hypothetical protein